MICMSASVVPYGGLDCLGNCGQVVAKQLFYRFALQVRGGFERLIQVSHIRSVMLTVMDFHCGLVDVGLQSIRGVGKWGKRKCHMSISRVILHFCVAGTAVK